MWDVHSRLDPRFEAGPAASTAMEEWIRANASNPEACVLLAEEEGRPIAYVLALVLENPPVLAVRRYAFVSELAVTADARRRGIGTRLLDAVHAWCAGKGVNVAEVNVAAGNPAAQAFWKKRGYLGFVERYRREFPTGGPPGSPPASGRTPQG